MCGGVLGFLPILGFWMFPLGVVILSLDFPPLKRKIEQKLKAVARVHRMELSSSRADLE